MTTLVLQPGATALDYDLFAIDDGEAILRGRLEEYTDDGVIERLIDEANPDLIAIRIAFGATEFSEPTPASPEAVERLEALVASAPLHLPPAIELIRRCSTLYPRIQVVLVFDTAFFATLPEREATYGIDSGVAERIEARRYGYHGLFHAAAVASAGERLKGSGTAAPREVRVLSICLEPQPEVVASLGEDPLTVTGGTTPLEGLPGETTCGEIDPSIVLELAGKEGWGPEQIDYALTHESGLSAIAGRRMNVGEALAANERQIEPAGRQLRYKILLAAGAGIAALGGLDAIVFSGRYRNAGEYLGPWLAERLRFPGGGTSEALPWFYLDRSLARLIAEAARGALRPLYTA